MFQRRDGLLLCLDCYERLQSIMNRQFEQNAAMLNFLFGEMEMMTGVPLGPRIRIPQPVIQNAPMTFNNIQVDRSAIGAINTGHAQVIDVALSYIKQTGDPALSVALKEFTQAVLDNQEIEETSRTAILEQLRFLSEQAVASQERKQRSVARAVLEDLAKAVSSVSGLVSLWEKLKPIFLQAVC